MTIEILTRKKRKFVALLGLRKSITEPKIKCPAMMSPRIVRSKVDERIMVISLSIFVLRRVGNKQDAPPKEIPVLALRVSQDAGKAHEIPNFFAQVFQ